MAVSELEVAVPDRMPEKGAEFMREQMAAFLARGGRISKYPPRAVNGAGYLVDSWRGSFYPVRR